MIVSLTGDSSYIYKQNLEYMNTVSPNLRGASISLWNFSISVELLVTRAAIPTRENM
jgi:hypothetical protein